jgi:hypothetical protein
MKKIGIILIICTGCATNTSDILKIGSDRYTISAAHTGLGSGLTSHSELREAAIKKATEFCETKNLNFELISSETNGVPGITSIDDTLNFYCR